MKQSGAIVKVFVVGLAVVASTTACATKKFVRTQVDEVGTRVESLSQSLESTQQATRENGVRITQVDAKTEQVGLWAKEAQTAANTANEAAVAANSKAKQWTRHPNASCTRWSSVKIKVSSSSDQPSCPNPRACASTRWSRS